MAIKIFSPTSEDHLGMTAIFETKDIAKDSQMKITDDRQVEICDTAGDESIGSCFVSPKVDGGEGTVQTPFRVWAKGLFQGAIAAGEHVQMGDSTVGGVQRFKKYAGDNPHVDLGVCWVGATDAEGEVLLY
jgi:hypothetical protein